MLTREEQAKLRQGILSNLDVNAIDSLKKDKQALKLELQKICSQVSSKAGMMTSSSDMEMMAISISDEITGYGPITDLMEDDTINDILVNGPNDIWVERFGKLEKTSKFFIDNDQLVEIARRLVGLVGRRIDDSSPLVDSRLPDGSRLNVVIPPIAIDGASISIRKFPKTRKLLSDLVRYGSMTIDMANFLVIVARCRINVIVSGGTGSGKTTLLNALSDYISPDERVVTMEDTAELRLGQPHVVRLETRVAGVEGTGAVTMQDLVINALRMRPERIIVGECRGPEAFQMLQAMNTGHDGSMSTLHANSPRDAISRLESMVMMANANLPLEAIRRNISSAVNIIVQASRLNDGSRKVVNITEIMGMENGNVVMQDIFSFHVKKERSEEGKIQGEFINHGLLSHSIVSINATIFNLSNELQSIFRDKE